MTTRSSLEATHRIYDEDEDYIEACIQDDKIYIKDSSGDHVSVDHRTFRAIADYLEQYEQMIVASGFAKAS